MISTRAWRLKPGELLAFMSCFRSLCKQVREIHQVIHQDHQDPRSNERIESVSFTLVAGTGGFSAGPEAVTQTVGYFHLAQVLKQII